MHILFGARGALCSYLCLDMTHFLTQEKTMEVRGPFEIDEDEDEKKWITGKSCLEFDSDTVYRSYEEDELSSSEELTPPEKKARPLSQKVKMVECRLKSGYSRAPGDWPYTLEAYDDQWDDYVDSIRDNETNEILPGKLGNQEISIRRKIPTKGAPYEWATFRPIKVVEVEAKILVDEDWAREGPLTGTWLIHPTDPELVEIMKSLEVRDQ